MNKQVQRLLEEIKDNSDKKITVYRLLARHTLDESKAAAMDQKIDFSKFVIDHDICATCGDFPRRCAKFKIKPFSDVCIHPPQTERIMLKVKKIP